MKRLHIVGRKNHGKTTLVVDLIRELGGRGYRVGTIKHSSHVHELDTPGKDSFRHRQAGASPAAIVTPGWIGVTVPREADDDGFGRLAPVWAGCDVVLIEGDLEGTGLKIEVWRKEGGTTSLATERGDIAAVVTDDPLDAGVPVWPRNDVAGLARNLIALLRMD